MSATACPDTCDSWDFAARYFGDCVCSRRDALSFVLGCVSIIAWGVAELPQIVANWRNRSSEGVSLAFIATWLTGDAFNLVGCAVSPTLPTQLYTAMLYTSTTVVLVVQHLHYNNRKRETEGAEDVHGDRPARRHRKRRMRRWNDDAARDGREAVPVAYRDASGDASDDEQILRSAAASRAWGPSSAPPGLARTFALLGWCRIHPGRTRSHPRRGRTAGRQAPLFGLSAPPIGRGRRTSDGEGGGGGGGRGEKRPRRRSRRPRRRARPLGVLGAW